MKLEVLGDGTTMLTVATRPGHDGRKEIARLVFSSQFAAGYRIERELGAGAMGAVYAGTQLATGRPVAVKFLLALGEPEAAARFGREARLLARISHPAVLRVIDVGEMSGHPFLVTDLLPGGSLRARLTKEVRLTVPVAIATAARVLEGLEACHVAGVVHRDLKPDNVMYDAEGKAVVVDLGIARLVDDMNGLTKTGAMVGTPRYMPPEAWSGDLVGPPADLFAVGVMLYESLAGRHPFEAAQTPTALMQLLSEGPPPLAEAARVPAGLAALVHRAMLWSPAARPASAAAMRAELTNPATLRSGVVRRPVSSRAIPVPPPPSKVRPGALAALVLGVGVCAALFVRTPAPPAPAAPSAAATPAASPLVRETTGLPESALMRLGKPGAQRVLAASAATNQICVSDEKGLHLVGLPAGSVTDVAPRVARPPERAVFSPDGGRLAFIDGYAAAPGLTTRAVADVSTGQVRVQWPAPTMHSWLVQLGPNGMFETSNERSVIWDTATGKRLWTVALSPSATHSITLDTRFTRWCRSSALMWDIVSRDTMETQAALLAAIDSAPKNTEVPREKLVAVPHAFSPDGKWVLLDERKARELWLIPSRGHNARNRMPHPTGAWLTTTAFSPDGGAIAGAYEDGVIAVWRTKDGRLLHRLSAAGEAGVQLAVDRQAGRLVSISAAGTALVYRLPGN